MAKQAGLGDNLYVSGFDVSGDVGAVNTVRGTAAVLDVTGINKSARERILGRRDGEISFNAWWDTATDAMHDALSTLPTTDRTVLYLRGTGVNSPVAMLLGKQINYGWDRGDDGALAGTVQVLSNGAPLEWGVQLTAGKQAFPGAAGGTVIDDLAATAFGAAAYLQVFSVGSGTAIVAVQDSADNAAFADVTGLVFSGATGRTEQRLETIRTATLRRFVRVNVTGTFTNALISVGLARFQAAI